jgi:prolyl oligopeptidase
MPTSLAWLDLARLSGLFTVLGAALTLRRLAYPEPPTGDHADSYHGVVVPDPYRPLEDPDAPATRAWIEAENRLTREVLEQIPALPSIRGRLTELWNYPRYGVPTHKGGRYFFFKNDGLQNQAVLYMQDSLHGAPGAVLDPNLFAQDGTIAVTTLAPSEDGRRLAYGRAASGSDWEELWVRDVATGMDTDVLRWVKFSGASWTHDHQGFFYSRYPEPQGATLAPTRFQKLYYHRLGTLQASDVLVYERPDEPDWGFGGHVTDDGRYLIITVWVGTDRRTRVYFVDLLDPGAPQVVGPVVRLLDAFDASYGFVGNDGPVFYFLTDRDAPRRRVVAIDTRQPAPWRELVPEGRDVIDHAQFVDDALVIHALRDAHSVLGLHRPTGEFIRDLPLPALGTVSALGGERRDRELFYAFTSFLHPTTIFRYDFGTGESEVFRAPGLGFDAGPYETTQVFYPSRDGTRIPLFVTHRRGLVRDASHPVLLSGYGGFNISLTPAFSPGLLVWLERGGIYAVPNLRGGGEYGEAWHEAGMREKKQNVFDDGIAAAEYLIAEGYTAPARLAITGGSNGGLWVGALLTQRPELFAAALPAVGVFDMLRFHKFTIGWAWVSEYGSADDPDLFPVLYGYSPLHRLKSGTSYPATFITTADHDDRVVPAHSFKFAAALQAAQAGGPVLIEIETKAGHGAGKPMAKVIEEQAHRWAFLVAALGMDGQP